MTVNTGKTMSTHLTWQPFKLYRRRLSLQILRRYSSDTAIRTVPTHKCLPQPLTHSSYATLSLAMIVHYNSTDKKVKY